MRKFWLLSLIVGLAIPLFSIFYTLAPSTSASKNLSLPLKDVRYKAYNLPSSVVHTLIIPVQSRFLVTVALSPQLDTLKNFAQTSKAIAALNGGFFDPINYKTISYVVKQGKLIADPHLNERLINNPHLASQGKRILFLKGRLGKCFNRLVFMFIDSWKPYCVRHSEFRCVCPA